VLFHRERISRRDAIFTIVVLIVATVLVLIPTKYHDDNQPQTLQARARVLSTDNSEIRQYGIVRQGDQSCEVEILNGRFKGKRFTGLNILLGKMDLDKVFQSGDLALVGIDLTDDYEDVVAVNMIDHYRIHVEVILFAAFVALLILFAGWVGARALVSFIFTGIVIWKVMLPLFLTGWHPILVALVMVTILTAVIVFLIGGFEKKGLIAFLGSVTGVAATCLLSLLFGRLFHIHGAIRPFSETLLYSGYAHLNLSQLFLAGIFIASSGAVMDIAMDIAASMKEVYDKNPQIELKDLVISGVNVGRAVIGTMTTTLLLAYSGGYTTLLMMLLAQSMPVVTVFNLTYVASEILHTLVGSFGLVLVAPLTAIIGAVIYHRTGTSAETRRS
jgi:uncharacterized membrane protein